MLHDSGDDWCGDFGVTEKRIAHLSLVNSEFMRWLCKWHFGEHTILLAQVEVSFSSIRKHLAVHRGRIGFLS